MLYVGTYLGVGVSLGHYGISVVPEYLLLVCPLVLSHEIFSVGRTCAQRTLEENVWSLCSSDFKKAVLGWR